MVTTWYSVWVGGSEVNDYPLTKEVAEMILSRYIAAGYDDASIRKEDSEKR